MSLHPLYPHQAAADALRRELAVEASGGPFDHQADAPEASHEAAVVDAPSAGAGMAPPRVTRARAVVFLVEVLSQAADHRRFLMIREMTIWLEQCPGGRN